jgi:hypothetical protein
MKKNNDETIYVRIPAALRKAIERERKRIGRAAGADVTTSAVIRAILERELGGRKVVDR